MGFLGKSTIKCCALGGGVMLLVTLLSSPPLATSLVFSAYYWKMWNEAKDYSDNLP